MSKERFDEIKKIVNEAVKNRLKAKLPEKNGFNGKYEKIFKSCKYQ